MGSHIILLIAVVVYCSEIYCNVLPTPVTKPEDLAKRHDSPVTEKGFFWKNLGLPRNRPAKIEESKSLDNTSGEMHARKSRLLNSLAFLAGLGFGGLATAASSTVKSIAKLPQATFSLNLGDTKTSPYFAAYYNPVLPYPFLYASPFKIVPLIDPTRPQTNSSNDLPLQVISVFDRKPIDLAESNEDYADKKEEPDNDKSNAVLQAEADRNAEEKTVIRECKEDQRRYSGFSKGSSREDEDPQMDKDDSRKQHPKTNSTGGNNATYYPPYFPFPGYYGGYPQNVNHVDLTTDPNSYHYHYDYPINPPHEQPGQFYHDDRYNVYSSPHLPGPYQASEYIGTDFNRPYHSEYQSPYSNGFRPVK